MTTDVTELRLDLEDLQYLRALAKRPRSERLLTAEINELKRQIALLVPATSAGITAPSQVVPEVKLHTYAWDQSEKFLKLYVTLKDVHNAADGVKCDFGDKKFHMTASGVGGKNYCLSVTNLLCRIDPGVSNVKVKTDMVVINLKKLEPNKEWECVTEQEFRVKQKEKPKFDKNEDPQTSLMSMMKDLYDQGDDEMKRTIKKSMYEAQMKRGQAPEMGDLPPMDL